MLQCHMCVPVASGWNHDIIPRKIALSNSNKIFSSSKVEQGDCTDNLFQVCKRFRNTESPPRAPTSSLNLMTRPTLHDIVSLVSPQIWGVGGARDGL